MIIEKNLVPKYHQIKEYIKQKINNGELSPHDRIMSENEIVKECNVSRQPVIQALKDLEKEGWIYRIQGKGSFCSEIKRDVSKNIGVVLTGPENYIVSNVISGITNTLSANDYSCIIKNVCYSPANEEEVINEMANMNVSGFIISPLYKHVYEGKGSKIFSKLLKKNIPFVLIDSGDFAGELPFVLPNDIHGGFIATQHLIDLGHKNIMIFSPMKGEVSHNRFLGYAKALKSSGLPVNQEYSIRELKEDSSDIDLEDFWGLQINGKLASDESKAKLTQTSYFHKIEELLSNHPEVTAAFCFNDLYATILIESLYHLGKKVPHDFSVVGFDDSLLAVTGDIKLTTVAHPKYNYGKRAAEIVLDMIDGKKQSNFQELISVELIVRNSTTKIN